jgi:molybdate transport system ATP-binding protein
LSLPAGPHKRRRRHRFVEVELRNVRLRLGGRAVLRGIDWHLRPGQRWVLMGPNGAGKTQLLKLLAGDVWPTPGAAMRRRYRCGGESFDDPYGIKEELAYLGPERQDRYEHYEWNHRVERIVATGLHRTDIPLAPLRGDERRQIARLLARLSIEALAKRRFLTLSYGERRLVLLARALAWRPGLLLLDEPLTGLDAGNRERFLRGLTVLSRTALPWVLSAHRPEDVPASATHLCRLERGRVTARRRLGAHRGSAPGPRAPARRPAAPTVITARPRVAPVPLISMRRVSAWREGVRVLHGLSFEVQRGDCWVIHGANGSGKSSLIQLIYGDLGVARGGSIARADIQPGVALHDFRRRVGLVAPELQAIYPRQLPVEELVASGLHASVGLNEPLRSAERRRARAALRRVGAAKLAPRTVRTLSYGQTRRVLFARALVNEPDILLLDEPYAGLDARTRAALGLLVERAIAQGTTTIMTTHHRDEWPARATHELELARGRVRYGGPLRRRRAGRPRSLS